MRFFGKKRLALLSVALLDILNHKFMINLSHWLQPDTDWMWKEMTWREKIKSIKMLNLMMELRKIREDDG